MIKNYEILKRENICSGKLRIFETIIVSCNKCQKEFKMGRIMYENKINIEYTYCPHCANKLQEKQYKILDDKCGI